MRSETWSQRYNPELQKKSLENRQGRQQDFNTFVNQLKEYSKSDKPSTHSTGPLPTTSLIAKIVWEAAADDEARKKAAVAEDQRRIEEDIQKRREEIKRQSKTPEKH